MVRPLRGLVRLSRQALTVVDERANVQPPRPRHGPSPAQLAARHMQVALRAGGPGGHPGWVAVLQQPRQVLAAIEDARQARRELVAASQLDGAGRVVDSVQHEVRASYDTNDLDGLREAHRAREAVACRALMMRSQARSRRALRPVLLRSRTRLGVNGADHCNLSQSLPDADAGTRHRIRLHLVMNNYSTHGSGVDPRLAPARTACISAWPQAQPCRGLSAFRT